MIFTKIINHLSTPAFWAVYMFLLKPCSFFSVAQVTPEIALSICLFVCNAISKAFFNKLIDCLAKFPFKLSPCIWLAWSIKDKRVYFWGVKYHIRVIFVEKYFM